MASTRPTLLVALFLVSLALFLVMNAVAEPGPARELLQETSFSCSGRDFGYYADIYSDCRGYFICNPATGETHAFWCPEGTIFDQPTLICLAPAESSPCEEAPSYWST